jgi:phosphoglycolate phosphatase-like HAD superfamily hydrolase
MKSFAAALAIAVLSLFAALPAPAQTATDELETARTQIQADRKAIVSRLMDMTETESTAFWPVYNEYREEIRKVDDKLVELSESYFKGADSLTDKQAQGMLSDFLKLRGDRLAVKKAYVKKFSKAIPTTKLVRYYQIENKMDAVIEYEMAAAIPLIQ